MGFIDDQFYTRREQDSDLKKAMGGRKPKGKVKVYDKDARKNKIANFRSERDKDIASRIAKARKEGDTKALKKLLKENYKASEKRAADKIVY